MMHGQKTPSHSIICDSVYIVKPAELWALM